MTLSCSLDISDIDFYYCADDWTDPKNVTVAGDGEQLDYADECGDFNGWTWNGMDVIDGDEEVELCGQACENVQNQEWSIIELSFWCCTVDGTCGE